MLPGDRQKNPLPFLPNSFVKNFFIAASPTKHSFFFFRWENNSDASRIKQSRTSENCLWIRLFLSRTRETRCQISNSPRMSVKIRALLRDPPVFRVLTHPVLICLGSRFTHLYKDNKDTLESSKNICQNKEITKIKLPSLVVKLSRSTPTAASASRFSLEPANSNPNRPSHNNATFSFG